MYVAGFDIGGTNARLSIFVEDSFDVVYEDRQGTRGVGTAEEMASLVAGMVAESGLDVSAVGIGLAAQLSKGGKTVVNAPNLGWRNVGFAELVEAQTQTSVRVVNDLNALAWGEFVYGAGRDHDDILAVYVGTGVGGAAICDGVLVEGHGGVAGEIGHAKVNVGGRLCGCGERGCVEAYAGGVHLEKQVAAINAEFDLSQADAGLDDAELANLWSQSTDYLAITVANACTLLNPGLLLLGGGVLSNLPHFRQQFLEKLPGVILEAARRDLEIQFGELGDRAGMIGAAQLAISTT